MNWKSTAIVSGVGVLATLLANGPYAPKPSSPARAPAPAAATVTSDIERQADHLRLRLRQEIALGDQVRDPFRFAPRRQPSALREAVPPPLAVTEAPPALPRVSLTGVALDEVDGREERTAILKTAAGLIFAHEGEEVAGTFMVVRITEGVVELRRLDDGSTVTLR